MSPISQGRLSFRLYHVHDPLPADHARKFVKELERNWFREIDPRRGEDKSIGWIDPRRILEKKFEWERVCQRPRLLLGLRRDRIALNTAQFKARCNLKFEQLLLSGKKISRQQRQTVEDEIRAEMRSRQPPSTQVVEWAWNLDSGRVWFAAAAESLNLIFTDLFAETFGCALQPALPFTLTDRWCAQHGAPGRLDDIWPATLSPSGASTIAAAAD